MINSRKIEDLQPYVQEKCKRHIAEYNAFYKAQGVTLIVTNTLRDQAYQTYLYSLGRTVKKTPDGHPQGIVTQVKLIGGHGFGLAYDVVPVVKGKAIWSPADLPKGFPVTFAQLWAKAGEIGKKVGAKWGGDWKTINDKPHFEYLENLSYADLRAGKRPSFWKR